MIIAIAGIKRSGSTVQFNLVRIALEMAGYKVNVCGHHYSPREVPDGEVDLVKRHPFDEDIAKKADYIFLTDRKDEEIKASFARFTGERLSDECLEDMRKHMGKWKAYTDGFYVFRFRMWRLSPWVYTLGIVQQLGLYPQIDHGEVLARFNEIEPPENGQDPKTLMFHNHITSDHS